MLFHVADTEFERCQGARLQSPSDAPVIHEQTMETSVPGLYAAGTAVAGTQQSYTLFIENCHIHVERIVAALTGAPPPTAPPPLEQLET